MPSIDQIPIHVLSADDFLTGQAEAVLTEVAEMLGRLLETGETGSIDLHGLPLSPADKTWLDEQLGRGEVEIILEAGGRSTLSESAYSGVWKVVHRDVDGRVVAEMIEVAHVPEIVKPADADIERAYENLQLNLKQHS
jgi:hydrogenase-1 operon protein HyaF